MAYARINPKLQDLLTYCRKLILEIKEKRGNIERRKVEKGKRALNENKTKKDISFSEIEGLKCELDWILTWPYIQPSDIQIWYQVVYLVMAGY